MRAAPWMRYADIEIGNANRTLTYVRRMNEPGLTAELSLSLSGDFFDARNLRCWCEATDEGPYISPAADDAPWYSTSVSGEFMGFLPAQIRVGEVLQRAAIPRARGGATIGRVRPKPRLVQVTGFLIASTARGMAFGERWMADALQGTLEGCGEDDLELLPACPPEGEDGEFRTLRRVGVVDLAGAIEIPGVAECLMQQYAFQMVAGDPYFVTAPVTRRAPSTPSGVQETSYVSSCTGETAAIVTIYSGTAAIDGLVIRAEDCAGYSDTYVDNYSFAGNAWAEYTVVDLPADSTLVIDASNETVRATDSSGNSIGGVEFLEWMGPFRWIRSTNCVTQCVYSDATGATVNGSTTVMVETVDREV